MVDNEFDLQTLSSTPNTTLGEIESVISSDFKEDWTWVVVEGRDDVSIYEPLFDPNTTIVRYSIDEKQQCGCVNVEKIVEEVLSSFYFDHIIGIRDADYTRYDSAYSAPQNVFLTDDHDIEMQMLNCQAVVNGLKIKKPNIVNDLKKAYHTMKQVGCLRAYSISIQCGFCFEGYVTMANFWDQNNQRPIDDWNKNLKSAFFNTKSTGYGQAPTRSGYSRYFKSHKLASEPDSHICQGHDVVGYLQWIGAINNPYEQFLKFYDASAFSTSNLYSEILNWQNMKSLSILKK